jgi:hypothetical protein
VVTRFAEFWRLVREAPRLEHGGVCAIVTANWRVAVLVEHVPPAGWQVVRPSPGGAA